MPGCGLNPDHAIRVVDEWQLHSLRQLESYKQLLLHSNTKDQKHAKRLNVKTLASKRQNITIKLLKMKLQTLAYVVEHFFESVEFKLHSS